MVPNTFKTHTHTYAHKHCQTLTKVGTGPPNEGRNTQPRVRQNWTVHADGTKCTSEVYDRNATTKPSTSETRAIKTWALSLAFFFSLSLSLSLSLALTLSCWFRFDHART